MKNEEMNHNICQEKYTKLKIKRKIIIYIEI
jgi:hypothetical protein